MPEYEFSARAAQDLEAAQDWYKSQGGDLHVASPKTSHSPFVLHANDR